MRGKILVVVLILGLSAAAFSNWNELNLTFKDFLIPMEELEPAETNLLPVKAIPPLALNWGFIAQEEGTDSLPFPSSDRDKNSYYGDDTSGFHLKNPKFIKEEVNYNNESGNFDIDEKAGNFNYRPGSSVPFDEYLRQKYKQADDAYWKERSDALSSLGRTSGLNLGEENAKISRLFGGTTVDIIPRGSIELIFGGNYQNIQNPTLPRRAQRQGTFDFDMNINMSATGKIGDKLGLTINYNTNATFDFENQIKLDHKGNEDDIIQAVEAGNVSFPLPTTLIQGSQNLFGLKTQLKFGRLTISSVFSQQKSKKESVRIEGGAQKKTFAIKSDQYDQNRHFFLSHFFRDQYEQALATLPVVNSQVRINRIEVWITNSTGITQNTRDVVGLSDLGEPDRLVNPVIVTPSPGNVTANSSNNLYNLLYNNPDARKLDRTIDVLQNDIGLEPINDFQITRARQLTPQEYSLNDKLGYISLNSQLKPDEVLAVAFEYTYKGQSYRVGEFSQDVPVDPSVQNILYLKMLKSISVRPNLPIWDLMMKNVYSLGAFQISPEDFRLDILYRDPGGAKKRYIPQGANVSGTPIIRLLNLDRLNNQLDPQPDGLFDFVPGVTINPQNGKIFFPTLEPFGEYLRDQFLNTPAEQSYADRYAYDYLYDSTLIIAQQFPEFNRYTIEGTYKSSFSSEIYLGGFNLPEGSVSVNSGGVALRENVDYTVDYNLGRVKIINEGILNSGVPIDINYESNNLFAFQTRTMIGNRFDYRVSENFNIGATQMSLFERPFTQKINVGDDPISNNIYGLDVNYSTELPGLTKAIDKLPFISTTAESKISVMAEGAAFRPGHSKAIEDDSGNGLIYIDDFEGSKSIYDLKFPLTAWALASTPANAKDDLGQEMFPEAKLFDSLAYGFNRSKLIWYNLDPIFQDDFRKPAGITAAMQSSHYVRTILEQEIFPNRQNPNFNNRLAVLDLQYYPSERGPYNYEASANGTPGISAGINPDGSLKDPRSRWGGIMRALESNDFEAANIEFIEFWVMDPFIDNPGGSGELYIDLGNISEDILKDSKKFFENGLPRPNSTSARLDTTNWGRVPIAQAITNTFDNDPDVLRAQDVGFDGLNNDQESDIYREYIGKLSAMLTAGQLNQAEFDRLTSDPSNDDFRSYLDETFTSENILERYKKFDGAEGNTSNTLDSDRFSTGSNLPNTEDLNRDNTLNQTEEYYQYKVNLFDGMTVSNNQYITDVLQTPPIEFKDGSTEDVKWYHFKIPISDFNDKIGGIQDFRSIRFFRMYLTEFEDPVILRFGRLELVRNQWRRYKFDLSEVRDQLGTDLGDQTFFNVSAVSLEENSNKVPIPYLIPPGVQREQLFTGNSSGIQQQNEQALALQVCDLEDGDARAVFKELNFDFRQYERLELFFHAEEFINGGNSGPTPVPGDLEAFIRLGADFKENYYEYSIPLKLTDPNSLGANEDANRELIWPKENLMDIKLDSLVTSKRLRNADNAAVTDRYTVDIGGGKKITIIGNPDIGNVTTAMIGLRNKSVDGVQGQSICAEVWVNEMRLKGISDDGGVAGLVRTDLQLADIGNVAASGSFHTIGYGQVEQKIQQRNQDNFSQFDVSANFELGKLLGPKSRLSLPMYAGVSNSFSRPRFDPFAFDLELDEVLNELSGQERSNYLARVQDFNSIRSLNFTNVKLAPKGKVTPFSLSNFNVSYSFTENFQSNAVTASDLIQRRKGTLGYNYSTKANYIYPLKKIIPQKLKFLDIVRQFNFNPVPNRVAVTSTLNRQYGELVLRDVSGEALQDTFYNKFFTWDRTYDLRWDLAQSLKFNFKAVNNARIDEPEGKIDNSDKRDSLLSNLMRFGRNTHYNHSANLDYNLPFSKIKALNWVNSRATYTATYDWRAASLVADSLGNIISNSQDFKINGDFNFRSLYSKSKFLRKMTTPTTRNMPRGFPKKMEKEEDKKKDEELEEDKDKKKKKKEKRVGPNPAVKGFFEILTSLKRINLNYNLNRSTTLPGYTKDTYVLGADNQFQGPGWDFLFGYQPDTSWLTQKAAANDWITRATSLNNPFTQTEKRSFDVKANLEPLQGLRIDVTLNKSETKDYSEFFRFDDQLVRFDHNNPLTSGSYTVSFFSLGSSFDTFDEEGFSENFRNFESIRTKISQKLGLENPYSSGIFTRTNPGDTVELAEFAEGYGPYSQEVLVPAFLSIYGADQALEGTSFLKVAPKPNWRITYTGLSKVSWLKEFFNSITLSHNYSSNMTVGNYISEFAYRDSSFLGYPGSVDTLSGNYFPLYKVPQITISEQLVPLIGIDLSMKNNLSAKFEWKKTRNVGLSLVDYQLIETRSEEITFGAGYRVKGLVLPFIRSKGKKIVLENDVNFALDIGFRDDETANYKLDQGTKEATKGNRTFSLSPSVDYKVSDKLNVRLFLDHRSTTPATSASFPISNTNGGVSVRFTIAE